MFRADGQDDIGLALAKGKAKTAYLDGELCRVGDDGLPS